MTQLIITQVLWGIAIALSSPAFDSVYSTHTNKNNSISEWSGWEGLAAISAGVAALIGGLIIESFGYQSIFLCMATISIGLGVYIWRLPREIL